MSNIAPLKLIQNRAHISFINFIQRHWRWIALLCLLILILPLFTPAGYFFWGLSSAKTLFQDELGIGESIATVFAVAFMFIYTLAIPYAARWLTIGRRRPSDVGIAFISVLFVFGSKPLLTGILGSSFNTQTGAAQKCYSWRGGAIMLSEKGTSGCGIDPVTGQQRSELTPDVAAILERQQHVPKSIATDGTPIQFFDPSSGRPTVWYDRAPDGSLELFDAEGFNPNTGKKLTAITADIAATVQTEVPRQIRPAPTTSPTYTIEVPKGGTIRMPSKESGDWSVPVRGRGGFRIFLDADRGRGSYEVQHLEVGSDSWTSGNSDNETAERYQSKAGAQDISYHFEPL